MAEWWELLGAPLDDRLLPPLAFSVWENDILKAGCFLCVFELGGGKGGLISWTIINPDITGRALRVSDKLISDVITYSRENGIILLSGWTSARLLKKSYANNACGKGDENTTQYILT